MLLAQFAEPELSILFTGLLTTWLFACGACVGSFLNVVVYRTPAGLSIAHPPSHCPHCQRQIRRQDNIPIYSWLALAGKCRHCAAPISVRYLLIELFVAITFTVLALFEGTTNGSNLPGTAEQFSSFAPTIWIVYGNQVFLLSTLWCIALIDFDRQRIPHQLGIPCLLVAGISMAIVPDFYPQHSGIDLNVSWQLNNLATGILGAATGALLGLCRMHLLKNQGGWMLAATLSGWVLGWQAIVVLLLSTSLLLSIGICVRVLVRGSLTINSDKAPPVPSWSPLAFPPTCWLIIVTPVVIITWSLWANWFPH